MSISLRGSLFPRLADVPTRPHGRRGTSLFDECGVCGTTILPVVLPEVMSRRGPLRRCTPHSPSSSGGGACWNSSSMEDELAEVGVQVRRGWGQR